MSYDAWKTGAPECDDDRGTCPVCDGADGEPCSEECAELIKGSGGASRGLVKRAEASLGKAGQGVASPDVHERRTA